MKNKLNILIFSGVALFLWFPFQSFAAGNTLASLSTSTLYFNPTFDGTLNDAQGNIAQHLNSGNSYVTGNLYSQALGLTSSGYVNYYGSTSNFAAVSLWVKLRSVGAATDVFFEQRMQIRIDSSGHIVLNSSLGDSYTSSETINDTNWHNIIVSQALGHTEVVVWLDGIPDNPNGSTWVSWAFSNSGFCVGYFDVACTPSSNVAPDSVADVGVFTSALSTTTVQYISGGSGPPPPPSTTASFIFPSTSGNLLPDFTNWKIKINAPTGTQINGTIEYQTGNQWTFVNKIFSDSFFYNMGNDTSTLIPILKSNTLWGNCSQANIPGCSQQWIAEINLNGNHATSAESIFYIGVTTSTLQLTSSTQDVGPFIYNPFQSNPSYNYVSVASSVAAQFAATSTGCPPAKDWTDIGGGIAYAFCSTINFLFVPGPVGMGQISSTISSLEGVPPYSWFFQVNNQVVSSASSTIATSTGLVLSGIPSGFGRTSTITVLRADPSTDSNLTRVSKYGPASLLELLWNIVIVGFIIIIIVGFYKLVF